MSDENHFKNKVYYFIHMVVINLAEILKKKVEKKVL